MGFGRPQLRSAETTNASGRAQINVTAGATQGNVTVTATAGSFTQTFRHTGHFTGFAPPRLPPSTKKKR